VLFYFPFLPVNPRLCAAISNLRSNKGGKVKKKKILLLRRQLWSAYGCSLEYYSERLRPNVVFIVTTVKRR
jgi:hypothetical protein